MKLLLLSGIFSVISMLAMAQSQVPDFGNITDSEQKLKECTFDKEADAVIIFDKAIADHNGDNNLVTTRRIRFKILKEKGIERGNIEIYYYSKEDFEIISDIKASIYNFTDAGFLNTKELTRSSIYRQKLNDRLSVVKFAMPDVKVGSIIEYEYVSTMKHYGGLDDWSFQSEIPTMLSSYYLTILPNSEFAYQVYKRSDLPIVVKPDNSEGKILFEMNDVAGLRDEPYMDSRRDYEQRVTFQLSGYQSGFGNRVRYMTTWDELGREQMSSEYFGQQITKNLSGTAAIIATTKALTDEYQKMKIIYGYVSKSMSWNGYEARATGDGVKEAWDKKKGTSGEINLILINLLKSADLDVAPLLVSKHGHGKVNSNYPFIDQFNCVMAYVTIGSRTYVLDASAGYTPPELIPMSALNTKAFIVSRKRGKGSIITLEDNERMNKNLTAILASVDHNGVLSGNVSVYSYDYARMYRRHDYTTRPKTFAQNYFTGNNADIKLDSLEVTNMDNDSLPLAQSFKFSVPPVVSGDYILVNTNLFGGFEKNPFISDVRFTNVDYGCKQNHVMSESISIPADMEPETLPKNIRLIMPDTSIVLHREMAYGDNTISIRYKIDITHSVFTADEYPYLKEFYKKMVAILNEQIVLRKKK
ncbi:MAG: DUF3857 domain-containing protein [Chitinophagaceae bacterium]